MAEQLRLALIPMSELERARLVTRIVADSEMVFGIWPDPEEAKGVGIQIIKGEHIMPPLVGFETQHEIGVAAIPCVGREVAVAASEAWGTWQKPAKEATQDTESAAIAKLSA